ncbi:hypothetical protein N7470_006638 [Penicillium chermesinum]|nr:hypothetical protein N7470_006638 [Penicillium chermesinum]
MVDMDEKPSTVERIEDVNPKSLSTVDDEEFTLAEQKAIIRRVDLRLVTMTGLTYCISLMDRTNLSAAAIAGMTTELALTVGDRYSLVVLMFFRAIRSLSTTNDHSHPKDRPDNIHRNNRDDLGSGHDSFVKNWGQLVGMRVLLGVLEAGYFPGSVYLLSCWYTRYDVQKRFSIFYLIGCVASALAGILAYGLMQLNGKHGLTGWRWIFILEGVITGAIGILCFIFLVDFPDRAWKSWWFLNERESAFIVRRINQDRNDGDVEAFSLKKFLKPSLDLKIWGFGLIFFCLTTVTYAIAYFLPIILRTGMGFGIGESQCLVAPPYAFAGIVMYSTAWVGDKYRTRGPVLVFNCLLSIIGLPMMGICHGQRDPANNVRGQWTRALSSATLVGMGGVGGIASSLVFREQDAPGYRPGMYAAIACNILVILIVGALSVWFWFSNRQADQGKKVIEDDPTFRYTI